LHGGVYIPFINCYSGKEMRNLFLPPDCVRNGHVILTGDSLHYLKNVRRVQRGDTLWAVIGERRYHLVVSSVARDEILCSIESEREVQPSDLVSITVYQGLLKGSKMDRVVARLAELGVRAFVPMITERSVPSASSDSRMERWKRLASEGAKVTGQEHCMTLSHPMTFPETLKNLNKGLNGVIILFCVENFQFHLTSYLQSLHTADGMHLQEHHFHLFFGPEGGFSLQEVEHACGGGGVPVSMGPFVLKSDTAAIVGTGFIRLYYAY
jgi:16S rRNA (uracil1498-N3)-methyltransferase